MAKKPRTPAPPRKVQAPQRRSDPKRPRSPEDRRFLIMSVLFAASGLAAVVIAGLFVFVFRGQRQRDREDPEGERARRPADRAGARGTPGSTRCPTGSRRSACTPLPHEALAQHIHQHLDIFVNGKHVTVPVGLGIYDNQFITELHTHSAQPEGLPGPPGRRRV